MQSMVFQFVGGLGIFLLGIKFLGEGLQKSAGDNLKNILDKFTNNPFLGVLSGIIVTLLIQSSSGTTVLTVALVNAGFMTLRQAIGVIMGANIGTTATAFIIGINIDEYSLPIMALGSFLIFFFNSKKLNLIGQTIFGFGSLFLGLKLMSTGMSPLRDLEFFHELTLNMANIPVLGVVVGTVFTMVVQSSTATIGILQGLYAENAISLQAAIPVLIGDNIGTTITAILASIGASIAARRAALTHVIFNIIGGVVCVILIHFFVIFITFLQDAWSLNPAMTIAFAHGTYNVTNTLIQFPFIGGLAWIVTKLIPGEDRVIEFKPQHLDPLFITQSSSVALSQAKLEVLRMGDYAVQGLQETEQFVLTEDKKHAEIAEQIEGALNNLDREITNYLVSISTNDLSDVNSSQHIALIDSVSDIERIGDHFENILELIDYKVSHKISISAEAITNLKEMFDYTIDTVKETFQALDDMDNTLAKDVLKREETIDKMEKDLRKQHIKRMNKGLCSGSAGIVFVDIISNLERIGDHAVNIADYVLEN